ncbi:hydrocephalus-inducing protein homolog [Cuculus canorus]|uniref:hydrocephalus-inducing protein homolog n=1 Tax=Cuculus canorus TaxID=55661 RepID=UPI0023AB0D23|nr:hydrocephalus-inducing protein homolog [Cuculus canorus]
MAPPGTPLTLLPSSIVLARYLRPAEKTDVVLMAIEAKRNSSVFQREAIKLTSALPRWDLMFSMPEILDKLLKQLSLHLQDKQEGDVLPNSSVEINVIFKPQEARVYKQMVYCDISGRETRLPLRIKGEGIGPQLCSDLDQLDIGKVSVESAQTYEMILFNKGAIDAFFSLEPPTTALGSCFTFLPQEGLISPNRLQIIKISFSSTILGEFTEEFRFNVNGSPEPVTLTIRCVIPQLRVLNPVVTFEKCFLKVPCQQMLTIVNDSNLPGCYRVLPQPTPPAFRKGNSLSIEQSLAGTYEVKLPRITQLGSRSETCHGKSLAADREQSFLQPFPSEVVFQDFVPCEVYEKLLVLRNSDKVPQLVKVIMERSPYFKLLIPSGVYRKIPPGLTATFRILFTPEENKDYFHQLTCIAGKEKLIVPIRAIGARPVLDFPDQLHFSVCPVNYSTEKTLLIRNVGNREAHYRISTQSPFSVSPSAGNLGVGEATQVTVEFHPVKTGDHSGSLIVHYDTGEDTHTSLYGAAVDVNIRLERRSLTIEKTYLTLENRGTVVIHNRSGITAHFQWKAFVTQEEEDKRKLRLCQRLRSREDDMLDCFLKECLEFSSLRECRPLLSGNVRNQSAKGQGDRTLFSSDIFTIDPVEGDVLPNSSVVINVIFKPQEARVYKQMVYCDISGRETRLPLRIKGEGIGPQLCSDLDQLDIGKVSVESAQTYEMILFNKGAIDAFFSLEPPTTALGSCFTFLPQEGLISPNRLQIIKISFSSTILGEFTEEFRFNVNGSPEPVTLTIRGCVTGPLVHFDVPSLSFGDVSFGFPRTLSCRLINTSSVLRTFNLYIPDDGSGEPSVTISDLMLDNTLPSRRRRSRRQVRPTEFTITPCRGIIQPQGFQDIQITLCSNTVKKYRLALVVDVEGVGKVSSLLLRARCVIPQLRVLNPIVTFENCFLKVPCQQTLTIVNDSNLPGCYRVLPQEHKDAAAVQYSSPVPCGIIQPCSSVEVPFTLEAQVTGEEDTVACVAAFGKEEFPLEIHLVSIAEGPVVYVWPSKINFGSIQVLQDSSRTLRLCNQTIIPASFTAQMAGKHSRWRIEPSQGVIPPNTDLALAVIANLDGIKKFKDEVKVFIGNSRSYIIPVQAVGVGTTTVINKPIAPEVNLGPHFR